MVGTLLTTFFQRCYVLLKINMFFLLFSVLGGIVLGVGPSLRMAFSLFSLYRWNVADYQMKAAKKLFYQNFWETNRVTLIHFGICFLLGINLWLAIQLKGLLFLAISFLLILLLLVCLFLFPIYLYLTLFLKEHRSIMLKISGYILFTEGKQWLVHSLGLILLTLLFMKIPAIGFFWGMGSLIVYWSLFLEKKTVFLLAE